MVLFEGPRWPPASWKLQLRAVYGVICLPKIESLVQLLKHYVGVVLFRPTELLVTNRSSRKLQVGFLKEGEKKDDLK